MYRRNWLNIFIIKNQHHYCKVLISLPMVYNQAQIDYPNIFTNFVIYNCRYISNNKKFLLLELEQLTGVAAILRFPMPELEDDDSDNEEKADWYEITSY